MRKVSTVVREKENRRGIATRGKEEEAQRFNKHHWVLHCNLQTIMITESHIVECQ